MTVEMKAYFQAIRPTVVIGKIQLMTEKEMTAGRTYQAIYGYGHQDGTVSSVH